MKIPKKFKLFGTTYNVLWDNKKMNNTTRYGESDYSTTEITLSDTHGVNPLSEDRIMDTFYHERTHAILDSMHKRDLSADEEFVDVFSKLLRQSIETAEY